MIWSGVHRRRRARRGAAVVVFGMAAMLLSLLPVHPAQAAQPQYGEWWFDNWGIQSKVWPLSQGSGVTVAVLDGGVNGSTEVLQGAVLPGTALQYESRSDGSGTYRIFSTGPGNSDRDVDQHGSKMAQLIAGRGVAAELSDNDDDLAGRGVVGAGVAPQAKILPVDITGGRGLATIGSFDHVLPAAIRWSVDHGARVISMSLASDTTTQCPAQHQEAIAYAVKHDVVVVGSAGNEGEKGNPSRAPGNCAGVLTVGAVDRQGVSPPWSERQPYVAVAAPGVDVPVINPNHSKYGGRPVAELTRGTSNSTALVAGAAALVRSKNPSMPARQVVQRLTNTTVAPPGQQTPNSTVGMGIVSISRAVDAQANPVASGAPNPVYARYDKWLASQQRSSASKQGPLGNLPLPALAIGAALVLLLMVGATLAVVLATRRGRRTGPPRVAGAMGTRYPAPGPAPWGPISPDGHWRWDGRQWVPNTPPPAAGTPGHPPRGGP